MQVNVSGNGTDLGAESCNLVSKHAGGRNLDSIVPVVVVVAECIGEVENGRLRDLSGVLSNVEVRRFHGALRHGVRNEEEIELSVLDFGLLDEASINVGALGRVLNELVTLLSLTLLEESLTDALVNDDQRDLRRLDLRDSSFFAACLR